MVSFTTVLTGAVAVGGWATSVAAWPVVTSGAIQNSYLVPRGRADIVKEILKAIGVFTDDTVYTWDFKKYPQFCDFYMETYNGGNCYITVECQKGGKIEYWPKKSLWQADKGGCKVGGWTNFDDPRIGQFAVMFRTKDGFEGQGLTEPVFQMQQVNNWQTWDATAMAIKLDRANRCEKGITPLNCDNGPFVCRFVYSGNHELEWGRHRKWSCGVPVKGERVLDKMEWPALNGKKIKARASIDGPVVQGAAIEG